MSCRRPAAVLLILVAAALSAVGCGAAPLADDADARTAPGDFDGAVVALRKAVATAAPAEVGPLRARLAEAVERAVAAHARTVDAALAQHDLAAAEAILVRAAAVAPEDDRVLAGRARTDAVRARGQGATTHGRLRLMRLQAAPPKAEDHAEWVALVEDLEWLRLWARAFPDGAALAELARDAVADFFVAQARQFKAMDDLAGAQVAAQKALKWAPGHIEAQQLLDNLFTAVDGESSAKQGDRMLAERRFDDAVAAYKEALARDPGQSTARGGLEEARRQWVQALLTEAREADRSGRFARAVAAVAKAREVGTDDPKLAAALKAEGRALGDRVARSVRPRLHTATAQGHAGAALVHARILLAVLPDDKDTLKRLAGLESTFAAQAAYRVALAQPTLPPPPSTDDGARQPHAIVAQFDAAILAGTQRRLGESGLLTSGVTLLAAKTRVTAKNAPHGTVTAQVPVFLVRRQASVEPRRKDYLDRVETVANPDWPVAQGRVSGALSTLNATTDALRPVLEEVNKAEASLHQLQEQIQEIRKKINAEDAAWYKTRPSPCPDGKLTCPQTRSRLRWQQNVDYYERTIEKENKRLSRLAPDVRRLQAAVDAAQLAFDTAQKTAETTPRHVPREVWLPHDYEVTRHRLDVDATLQVALREGTVEVANARHTFTETRTDFSTGTVMVKGQVLEPQRASELPEDATLLTQLVDCLLAVALAPVVEALKQHGTRFTRAAGLAKTEGERLHWLVLAARAQGGLPEPARLEALRIVAETTGYRVDTGAVDWDRVPLLPVKAN